ncbi:solute carrier organic anion transporter family member 2A1 [Poecilia formosa]|uniref:solute carrier organic anion transporter family member 2A1 n=1 Tax=Poecilia formosa TaxID=48698 RepID=UPI0007BA7543|nr:PREDICTED: solute carrier organic anion transporter family member 2A1 [Poecilia formosa]
MEINYPTNTRKPNRTAWCNIKLFVLCHGFLQLSQLLYSAYFRSTISTIERRYGLNSFSSGTISSLHEVSNCILIVFVSYFGSRVHRPRVIGVGGLLMAVSAMLLTLPHFLSQPYTHDSALQKFHDLCIPHNTTTSPESCGREDTRRLADTTLVWILMAIAQLLFGVGSVPIQPFGISYIDDFAGSKNSPLYIAILFAVSVFGPSLGYLLGSVMLRFYVDVNRSGSGVVTGLSPVDPGWVGAWWMGLLIISGFLTLSSIPYFFFPRQMSSEVNMSETETDSDDNLREKDRSLLEFLKLFPRMFFHLMSNPLFLLLVLAQCCFSSVIAGLASFLSKFLERQYGAPVAYSTLLVVSLNQGIQVFTNCKCVSGADGQVKPGHCPNSCSHYLLPVILLISLASLIACLTHNPLYMMVLRCVSFDEKSFAIGLQFLLMRVLAWLPAPALFGTAIDMSCIWWKNVCGRKFSCEYYDNTLFRSRYLGLQVGYKIVGIFLLIILGWKAKRTQEYDLEKKPEI